MLSGILTSAQSNALIQYAVFFLLIIGLFLVIISAALIDEQNDTETINTNLIETANSRVERNLTGANLSSQLAHGSLFWKVGLMNIALNMSILAALYSCEEKLEPWVTESMFWRLLFCFGVTWASMYDGRLVTPRSVDIPFQFENQFSGILRPTRPWTAAQQ